MTLRHLYVHVPFCLRRCSYCDFAVTASREPPIASWLDAVEAELRQHLDSGVVRAGVLDTLYVGGGTPSLLGTGGMTELGERISRHLGLGSGLEWTSEANPETFTAELAREWRAAGVSRVSLGVQTFHEETLRWMGRMHGPDGPARAVEAARSAGLENLSLDLIFGLPGRLERDWERDVERVLGLEPAHVSLYGLTAEPATPLGRWVAEGRERLATDDTYAEEYLFAAERLPAAGFVHYEVSNFARAGCESRHNAAYWSGTAYLGLGPGSHSYVPPLRFWNVRDWSEYRTRLGSGGSARASEEVVDAEAASLERTWLGLRTRDGLCGLTIRQEELARNWESAGLARVAGGRARLTPRGWLLLDRLAVEMEEAGGEEGVRGASREGAGRA